MKREPKNENLVKDDTLIQITKEAMGQKQSSQL